MDGINLSAAPLQGATILWLVPRQEQPRAYPIGAQLDYQNLVKEHPKLAKFLKGWMNRTDALREYLEVPNFA